MAPRSPFSRSARAAPAGGKFPRRPPASQLLCPPCFWLCKCPLQSGEALGPSELQELPTAPGPRPSPASGREAPSPAPSFPSPKLQPELAPARTLSRAQGNSPRASGTRWWMQFRSPTAARSSLAPQAASSSEAAAPAPGQPGPSCPAPGASRRGRPGTPPVGRVEEEEEEEEDVDRDPNPTRNTWLRCCHFSLRGRREPGRAMGGSEVREFLLQFGFFLPLLTAWPGDCSHVSNNQGKGRGGEARGGRRRQVLWGPVHWSPPAGNFVPG